MTDMYQRHQPAVPPQRRPAGPATPPAYPAPVQTRTKTIIIPPRDGRAMTILRATAYVLTSLASLLFIAVVIYGVIQLGRAQSALEELGTSIPSVELPPTADVPLPG